MIEAVFRMALALLAVHWLCDYPLQGQFLSDAKSTGPLRLYHVVAHAGIQGAGVMFVTGNIYLGVGEWACHAIIDNAKAAGKISFAHDQALHIACKAVWLAAMVVIALRAAP